MLQSDSPEPVPEITVEDRHLLDLDTLHDLKYDLEESSQFDDDQYPFWGPDE